LAHRPIPILKSGALTQPMIRRMLFGGYDVTGSNAD
jgi:hypothetical protein